MNQINYLIGRGELLTHNVRAPGGGGKKAEVYTFAEAKQLLVPQFETTSDNLDMLPDLACPHDIAVAKLTLNPGYIAKSYFPISFLRAASLESVGSRGTTLTPRKWTKKGVPDVSSTTEIFVAGKRDAFRNLSKIMSELKPDTNAALDLAHIEEFSTYPLIDRVRDYGPEGMQFFEVGMHLLPDEHPAFIQGAFIDYANN